MNYKIMFIILCLIFVVSLIFYFSMEFYIKIYDTNWNGLINLSNAGDEKNKIFLLGSSNLYAINATNINEKLSKNNKNHLVYNLADMADNPARRLNSIENVISNKPEFVLYGVGIWEFQKFESSHNNYSITDFLLEPREFFLYFFESSINTPVEEIVPISPKDRMLTLLKYVIRGSEQHYHPFIEFKETPINDIEKIEKIYGIPTSNGLDLSDSNRQVIALKKIVNELEKNNIKVVLFSIPQHEHVIDSIEKSEIEDFKNLLIKISNSNTYFLHDEYSQMNIWRESFHIAVHPDASIYTDDMYEIILKEIKE